MKKYISVLVALLMLVSLCACNKDDDDPTLDGGDKAPSSQGGSATPIKNFKGRKIEPVMSAIASGSYMYEIKTDGDETPITYQTVAGKELYTVTMDGTAWTFMRINGKIYVVMANQSAYAELTPKVAKDSNIDLSYIKACFDVLNLEDYTACTYKDSGTQSLDSGNFAYEDYYDPLQQITRRFYFDESNNLKSMTYFDAQGKQGTLSQIFLMPATNSVFDKVSSYTLVDLEEQNTVANQGNVKAN